MSLHLLIVLNSFSFELRPSECVIFLWCTMFLSSLLTWSRFLTLRSIKVIWRFCYASVFIHVSITSSDKVSETRSVCPSFNKDSSLQTAFSWISRHDFRRVVVLTYSHAFTIQYATYVSIFFFQTFYNSVFFKTFKQISKRLPSVPSSQEHRDLMAVLMKSHLLVKTKCFDLSFDYNIIEYILKLKSTTPGLRNQHCQVIAS